MSFFNKRACTVPRVLSLEKCPPDEVPHMPSEYPLYYDALYFPEFHPSVFETPDSFCRWLTEAVSDHLNGFRACSCTSFIFPFAIDYRQGCFNVTFGPHSMLLSTADVESSSFTVCRTLRRLVTFKEPFDTARAVLLNGDPTWCYRPDHEISRALMDLSAPALFDAVRRFQANKLRNKLRKNDAVRLIVRDFVSRRLALVTLGNTDVVAMSPDTLCGHRFCAITRVICHRYGNRVAGLLRSPLSPTETDLLPDSVISDDLPQWMNTSHHDMVLAVRRLPKKTILGLLNHIPSYARPSYNSRYNSSCASALVNHIRHQISHIASLSNVAFWEVFFAICPFTCSSNLSRALLTEKLIREEYGNDLISIIAEPRLPRSIEKKKQRQAARLQSVQDSIAFEKDMTTSWPKIVDDDVIFQCLEDYRTGTIWTPHPICCVCGLERPKVIDVEVNAVGSPLNFYPLHATDPHICNNADFQYGLNAIDGAILEPLGFKDLTPDGVVMQICSECHSSLAKDRLPRLALANRLYRGKLPDDFKDLTWVEEMVCAKFRNTAHITRIYQSSDPSQPKVFHGNTCAHDMNLVSTASVLPRTPADINGMLSVVFVGPGKFKADCLGPMFRIRKRKVWAFLQWLKINNRLYHDLPLDESIMDLYPEDGTLPDIENGVVEDVNRDATKTFLEETAGVSEHPAEVLKADPDTNTPLVLLEKMGVSDPEGAKLTGRTFMSSALKNLIPGASKSQMPDLVIHRSSAAVREYNNPDLVPGMFPTLFPLGLGGFDDPARVTKLSFEAQANAFLDVPDRSFRYHHSYIFVVLNIIQRRTAHLQTHFTVRRSKFDSVARRLAAVSPDVLQSLANHLEHEGKLSVLTEAEHNAMDLLKQVNAISARIPGSQASKIFVRNEIRSYFSEFGLPHIYFTFNPSATHSPIFQVMFGDQSVDLTSRFPFLVPSNERAL
jgi:hypothetical protein